MADDIGAWRCSDGAAQSLRETAIWSRSHRIATGHRSDVVAVIRLGCSVLSKAGTSQRALRRPGVDWREGAQCGQPVIARAARPVGQYVGHGSDQDPDTLA